MLYGPNWHAANAYTYLDVLGSTAFAWEFLRRNADYQATWRLIASDGDPTPEMSERLAQRWGLRFRGQPGPARRPCRCRVAPTPQSSHCHGRASPEGA
jgi:hypothetical protein